MMRIPFRLNRLAVIFFLAASFVHSSESRDWIINPFTGETCNEGTLDSPLSIIQIAVNRAPNLVTESFCCQKELSIARVLPLIKVNRVSKSSGTESL